MLGRREWRVERTKESGSSETAHRQRGKKAEKKNPAERDEDSRRAGLLWPLAGTPTLFKVALWHPCTQLSSPSFFHPRARLVLQNQQGDSTEPIYPASPRCLLMRE